MQLAHAELSERIIGAAIKVHTHLGPGFIESIEENALVIELRNAGLFVVQQHEVIIKYSGTEVGRHRLDLFVENTFVVELKAIKNLEDIHFAIVKSYLKATGLQHGLILNFAQTKLEARRVMLSQ